MEVAWKMSEQPCEQVNGQFCFDLIHMNQKFTFSLSSGQRAGIKFLLTQLPRAYLFEDFEVQEVCENWAGSSNKYADPC